MNDSKRYQGWSALSDLFLDTEIDDLIRKDIAVQLHRSGYPIDEVEDILWAEVYPVLKNNLASLAGVWQGWSDSWLLENLTAYKKPEITREKSIYNKTTISEEINHHWQLIKDQLKNIK